MKKKKTSQIRMLDFSSNKLVAVEGLHNLKLLSFLKLSRNLLQTATLGDTGINAIPLHVQEVFLD